MRPARDDRFAILFAGFDPALLELGEAGEVVAANDGFCHLVGRPRDEVVGATPPLPWWSKDQQAWLAAQVGGEFEYAAGRGRFSTSVVHSDGSCRQVVASASVLVDGDGGRRLVLMMRDSHRLRRAAGVLGEGAPVSAEQEGALESRLRRLFDANIIGIITGQEDRILQANDAFLDMIGYSRDELERGGIDWPELTPPEWRATDAAAGVTAFRTGVSGPLEKQYVHRDGRRVWVRIAGAVVEWEPYRWVCFVEDIDDRHRAEAAREAAEAERDTLLEQLADTNAQLQRALDARVVVEQAKGRLAGELGISVDEAFEVIRHRARSSRRSARSVAEEIVERGALALRG